MRLTVLKEIGVKNIQNTTEQNVGISKNSLTKMRRDRSKARRVTCHFLVHAETIERVSVRLQEAGIGARAGELWKLPWELDDGRP